MIITQLDNGGSHNPDDYDISLVDFVHILGTYMAAKAKYPEMDSRSAVNAIKAEMFSVFEIPVKTTQQQNAQEAKAQQPSQSGCGSCGGGRVR